MVLLGQLLHVLGDLLAADVLAQVVVIDVGLHLHQVDDPLEGVLAADGQLDGHRVALEAVFHHLYHAVEVGAHDVHLVHVGHTGDLILFRLAPDRLGLGLYAALGAEHGDRAVQHAQGTLHLHGEVHVSGGVDDVDTVLPAVAVGPETGGGGGSDGDAALLLLGHPVHGGGTLVGLADLVVYACIEQDTLCSGGLTGVDVGHDADISR